MNISLKHIVDYLEEKEKCKVITVDNSLSIIDLEKQQLSLHNKDYRLLNDLAKDYVKGKYPLFHREFSNEVEDVVLKVFRIPIDKKKLKKVKPFKKIIKKKIICSPNKRGQVITRSVIRRRDIS